MYVNTTDVAKLTTELSAAVVDATSAAADVGRLWHTPVVVKYSSWDVAAVRLRDTLAARNVCNVYYHEIGT